MKEVNLANNLLTSLPSQWIDTWGTMNTVGKLVHPSSTADAPIINVLGNSFQFKDSVSVGADPDEMEISW
jgi:hypothetical protein